MCRVWTVVEKRATSTVPSYTLCRRRGGSRGACGRATARLVCAAAAPNTHALDSQRCCGGGGRRPCLPALDALLGARPPPTLPSEPALRPPCAPTARPSPRTKAPFPTSAVADIPGVHLRARARPRRYTNSNRVQHHLHCSSTGDTTGRRAAARRAAHQTLLAGKQNSLFFIHSGGGPPPAPRRARGGGGEGRTICTRAGR